MIPFGFIGSGDPDALAYFAARPSLSFAEKAAITRFVTGLKSAGLWSKMQYIGLLCGGSFSDLFAANLKGANAMTNHSFVSGDFNPSTSSGYTTGLAGNGSTKYLDSGVPTNSVTFNDAHISLFTQSTGTGSTNMSDCVVGRAEGGACLGVWPNYSGNQYAISGTPAASYTAAAGLYGYRITSRTGSASMVLYKNGSALAFTITANSGTIAAGETGTLFAAKRNSDGAVANYSDRRHVLWTQGSGLTSDEAPVLSQLVSDLTGVWFCNPTPAACPYVGPYLFPSFKGNGADEVLQLLHSQDGQTWLQLSVSYTPSTGTVRDPSLFYSSATATWFLAHTNKGTSGGSSPNFFLDGDSVSIARCTNIHQRIFEPVTTITFSGAKRAWGAFPFTDPNTGTTHLLVAVSTTNDAGPFTVYETHPTSADCSTWSTPVAVTGLPSMYDARWFYPGDGYYYIYGADEDEAAAHNTSGCVYRSSTILGTYSVHKTPAQCNWGANYEGFTIINDGGTWKIWGDSYLTGSGMYYNTLNSDFTLAGSWTAITALGTTTRNGNVMKISPP